MRFSPVAQTIQIERSRLLMDRFLGLAEEVDGVVITLLPVMPARQVGNAEGLKSLPGFPLAKIPIPRGNIGVRGFVEVQAMLKDRQEVQVRGARFVSSVLDSALE